MGNTSSVPERIYKAARANDVSELQVRAAAHAAAPLEALQQRLVLQVVYYVLYLSWCCSSTYH